MLSCGDGVDTTIFQRSPGVFLLTTHVKVILLSMLNAALVAGGGAFQRLNAERHCHPIWSGWMLLAIVCLAPSFLVVTWAYSIGGKMSLFVPVTAVGYVFAHPWDDADAPPLHAPLRALPARAGHGFVHDLAVVPAARGLDEPGRNFIFSVDWRPGR